MAYDILQSSTQSPLLFLMVSSTDHISAVTGITPTVTISKAGGTFASPSGAVSEIANGWYKVAGNATDTGTLGPLALHATGTGADPTDIVVANVVGYDPQSNDLTATMKTSVTTACTASTPTAAAVTGAVGSVTGAVGSVTGNVGGNVVGSVASVTAGVTVTTNSDKTGYALSAAGSAAMTEGYAAIGAAPTIAQLLYEIRALLAEKSIASTTLTTKKLDGLTTAATYTLNDATTPSAITRAT